MIFLQHHTFFQQWVSIHHTKTGTYAVFQRLLPVLKQQFLYEQQIFITLNNKSKQIQPTSESQKLLQK